MLPTMRRLRRYCRLQVEGEEHVPSGAAIVIANHTGWAGLDYAMLGTVVHDDLKRTPRVAIHPTYYRIRRLKPIYEQLGFFEVSVQTSTKLLDQGELVTFFPEGEEGNFKPLWKRYRVQPFKPGFARVALASLAPIVPVTIVGGEDSSPTLGRLRPLEDLLDAPIPLPLSLLPLPAKWRITFHPPIDPGDYLTDDSPDKDIAQHMADDLQRRLQGMLDEELDKRGNPFF